MFFPGKEILSSLFNRYVIEPAKSYLGIAAIDWGNVCTQYGLNIRNCSFDVTRENNAWGLLLQMTRDTLSGRAVRSWSCELKSLEVFVVEYLSTRSEAEATHVYQAFNLFKHFIFLSLNQGSVAPNFSSADLSNERMQRLLQLLLSARFQALPKNMGLDVLLERGDELKALLTLLPSLPPAELDAVAPSSGHVAALIYLLNKWLLVLVGFLKKCFLIDTSYTRSGYEYAKVANILWDLAVRFELDEFINNQEIRDTLLQAYEKTLDYMQHNVTPAIDEFLVDCEGMSDTASMFFNLQYKLESLNQAYAADLESLMHWGESHYRRVILKFSLSSAEAVSQGMQDYFDAYQVTHKRIEGLSSKLYRLRNKLERILQSHKWDDYDDYINQVDFLNTRMLQIEDKLTALQKSWLGLTNRLIKTPLLLKASDCLDKLLTPAVKNLHHIVWAEYTAYCSALTEEPYAFEMQKRTHIPHYHLDNTQTQSDYLLFKYWDELSRDARPILAFIHPDKFQSTPELMSIARFCTSQIIQLRERAEKVRRMWGFSQWYDVSKREVDELCQEDTRLTCEKINSVDDTTVSEFALETKIEVPHLPEDLLTLNILRLNQRYQAWAKAETSLDKRARGVESYYAFYPGSFNTLTPLLIFSYNLHKQQFPGNRRRMNYLEQEAENYRAQIRVEVEMKRAVLAEIAQTQAALEQKEAEIAQIQAAREQKEAERTKLEAQKVRSIKAMIKRSLPCIVDNTHEGIQRLKLDLLTNVSSVFEEEAPSLLKSYIDECVQSYLEAAPSPEQHVAQVRFFAQRTLTGNVGSSNFLAAAANSI